MTASKKLVSLLVFVTAAACAHTAATTMPEPACDTGPAWTCAKSGPCEDMGFEALKGKLCAVGTADQIGSYNLGIQTATTRARTEMGAVLKTKVDGFTRAVQDSMSKSGAGEDSIQKIGDLAQQLTESTLYGVSVPATHFDRAHGVYFAMAVLDTNTFINALKGLKDAKGLSDSVKAEIDQRANDITNEWQSERAKADAGK